MHAYIRYIHKTKGTWADFCVLCARGASLSLSAKPSSDTTFRCLEAAVCVRMYVCMYVDLSCVCIYIYVYICAYITQFFDVWKLQ